MRKSVSSNQVADTITKCISRDVVNERTEMAYLSKKKKRIYKGEILKPKVLNNLFLRVA
jgi:hypothetical protein